MIPKSIILEKEIFQKITRNRKDCQYEIMLEKTKEKIEKSISTKVDNEWKKFEKNDNLAKNNLTFFSINEKDTRGKDYVFARRFKYVQSFSRTPVFENYSVLENNLIPLSSICLIETKDGKFIFGIKENMNKKISGFSGYMLEKDLSENKKQINLFNYLFRTINEELNLDYKDINKIHRIGKVYSDKPLDNKGLLNNRAKNNVFWITLNKTSLEIKTKFKKNHQFKKLLFCDKKRIGDFLQKYHYKMSIHCVGAIYALFCTKRIKTFNLFSKKILDKKIQLPKKKVLITGINGFVGRELANNLMKRYSIIGIDLENNVSNNFKFYQGDISNPKIIQKIFSENKIDFVVPSAAEKSLKICETKRDLTYGINYLATKQLSRLSKKNNSKFIFISSDIVFDGKTGDYSEDDLKHPINHYGTLKDLCEEYLLEDPKNCICRTALVFGKVPQNQKKIFKKIAKTERLVVQGFLVEHVLERLRKGNSINLSRHEYCSPTGKKTLSRQINKILEKNISGIIHCCGGEKINKYDFGKKVAKLFHLDKKLIKEDKCNDILRPKDVSLNCKKSEKILGLKFPNINKMILEEYDENFNEYWEN